MPWIVIIICCVMSILICLLSQAYSRVMSLALALMFSVITTLYYFNGVDWLNYYFVFDYFRSSFDIRYDLLFNAYLYVMANIVEQFQIAIAIFYFFCFYLLYRVVRSSFITLNGPAFITCIVLLGGLSLILDQIRQFAAVTISFFACNSLMKNNKKGFYKYVFLAVLFHYSAVFLLLFQFFYKLRKSQALVVGSVIIALFVFLGGVVLFNLSMVANIPFVGVELYRKAALYTRDLDSFKAEIGFGALADVLIIGYYMLRRNASDHLDKLWSLAFICACFHIGFYFLPAFSRFNYFGFIPLSYIFGHALSLKRERMGFAQVSVIGSAITIMIVIVTAKTFSDPNRPSWSEYSLDAAFYDTLQLDQLRSNRCATLENDVNDFCAVYK